MKLVPMMLKMTEKWKLNSKKYKSFTLDENHESKELMSCRGFGRQSMST